MFSSFQLLKLLKAKCVQFVSYHLVIYTSLVPVKLPFCEYIFLDLLFKSILNVTYHSIDQPSVLKLYCSSLAILYVICVSQKEYTWNILAYVGLS